MKHRLTSIVTRSGDDGSTGLADGSRLAKDSPRVAALGDIDELNCAIGVLAAQLGAAAHTELLRGLQNRLFDLGGELALPGSSVLTDATVATLDAAVERFNRELPPLREFVLPGGAPAAAHCHLARAQCRRAERALWRLARDEAVNPASLRYLNRLSDLLFVLARTLARSDGGAEITWSREPQ